MKSTLVFILFLSINFCSAQHLSMKEDIRVEDLLETYEGTVNEQIDPVLLKGDVVSTIRSDSFMSRVENVQSYIIVDLDGTLIWPRRNECSDGIKIYYLAKQSLVGSLLDWSVEMNATQRGKVNEVFSIFEK
jgi:hypothetical protein